MCWKINVYSSDMKPYLNAIGLLPDQIIVIEKCGLNYAIRQPGIMAGNLAGEDSDMLLFVLIESLCPSQQLFSYVGTDLPGLNQY